MLSGKKIKKLQSDIEELKAENEALKSEVDELKQQISNQSLRDRKNEKALGVKTDCFSISMQGKSLLEAIRSEILKCAEQLENFVITESDIQQIKH